MKLARQFRRLNRHIVIDRNETYAIYRTDGIHPLPTSIERTSRLFITRVAISQTEIEDTRISPSGSSLLSLHGLVFDNLEGSLTHQTKACVSSTITSLHPSPRRLKVLWDSHT